MNEFSSDWKSLVDVELSGLAAPQQARWTIRERLANEVSVPFLRDVMLATSELVTNAIRYAPGPCRLTLVQQDGTSRLRIGVSDTNPEHPHVVEATPDPASTGRGLMIIESVSADWGTVATADGKQVWFEMTPERRA